MKIGFIGLGIMGKPMVKNLIRHGYELMVTDHHEENIRMMTDLGAREGTARALAAWAEVVITMLPNSPQVRDAVLGDEGILSAMKPGSVLIDMSSIAPLAAKEIAVVCKQSGVDMLDAPVSGGEPKAIDGTLAIMVGGDPAVFERMKPILLSMGSSATWCGESGAGNMTKLANQIVVGANIAAVAEALTLAVKSGLDPQKVFDAIKGGLAGSTVMNAKAPMMIRGDYKPGFRIDLHIKDLMNATETAEQLRSVVPLTDQVLAMFHELREDGFARDDHAALARWYEKHAGTPIYDKEVVDK